MCATVDNERYSRPGLKAVKAPAKSSQICGEKFGVVGVGKTLSLDGFLMKNNIHAHFPFLHLDSSKRVQFQRSFLSANNLVMSLFTAIAQVPQFSRSS